MSSRNQYLSQSEREQAIVLYQALRLARTTVRDSTKPVAVERLRRLLRQRIESEPAARVDYVEFFEGETLFPAARVTAGTHLALAVFIGKTRLIDNLRVTLKS